MNQSFVRPIRIQSPISGQTMTPRLVEKIVGDKIHVEAHWYDPANGSFVKKGLVEIKDKPQEQK